MASSENLTQLLSTTVATTQNEDNSITTTSTIKNTKQNKHNKPRRKTISLLTLKGHELLTSHQVSKALGVDPSSVGIWVESKKLNGFRTPGGHLRILAADLLEFCKTSGYLLDGDEKSVSTFEAAKILGVSSSSIITWIRQDLLKSWKTPGGHNRIKMTDIEEFADRFKMHININVNSSDTKETITA